jgi:hypothetical protein
MGSITDVDAAGTCDTCARRTDDLQRRAGDNVCEQCDALLTAAHALLDNDVLDEASILGTLAFAWSKGAWTAGSDDYGGLEYLGTADGVPVLRLPDIMADVVTYDGSCIPKAIKIYVYSRHVKPKRVAETYQEILENHKIHYDKCSAGSVAWDMEHANLTLTVRAMKELHPGRVSLFKTYPAGRIYSFPPPTLVSGFYRTLLGSTDKRTFSGYAYALATSGRHTPQKAAAGSVAWLLGERRGEIPPGERRPRIAKTLNKHLLAPRDEPELPERYWTPDDTVWRDASRLGPRLMRSLYHLQEARKQRFPQTSV